jgi:hypothetical protein
MEEKKQRKMLDEKTEKLTLKLQKEFSDFKKRQVDIWQKENIEEYEKIFEEEQGKLKI